ncbi:MAG: fused MFS/spermidine synthase, partial [Paracoccaceae bacterium]
MPRPLSIPPLVAMQTAVSAASLVVEIVAGRMLAPYVGMSLYTWTSIIAVVLAGFSAGHWLGGHVAEHPAARALRQTGWTMIAAALTTAAAVLILRAFAGPVLQNLQDPVAGIALLTLLVFFLPSFFAGVPAPVLARIAVGIHDRPGRSLGTMFAAGALGAIGGTLLAGFVFISWLGSVGTMVAVAVTYLIVALGCFLLAGGARRGGVLSVLAGLVVVGLAAASLTVPSPCTRESRYFCIRVLAMSDDAERPVRLMVIDHLGHGISARDTPQIMQTDHAAMLDELARHRMQDRAFSAFLIGGGSYSIPRAWSA